MKLRIKKLKKNKACGPDGILAEMIQATEELSSKEITDIANDIYDSGEIPTELVKSIFVALPKNRVLLSVSCTER